MLYHVHKDLGMEPLSSTHEGDFQQPKTNVPHPEHITPLALRLVAPAYGNLEQQKH